jgi:cytochrome P450
MGPEAARSRDIIEIIVKASNDFGRLLGGGEEFRASFWKSLISRTNFKVLNPLQVHVQNFAKLVTPMILERRRLEAQAVEEGIEYDRPDDILQRLLDNFDKYGLVDFEDVCGHLLIMALTGVETTTDTATKLLYYMAAYPQYTETLYKEQCEVLDAIQQEREEMRQDLLKKGDNIGEDLDPAHDRDLTSTAIKKMIHMDSFVREMFRFRTGRLSLSHRARKTITLSNGVVVPKGHTVIINMKSAHQSPDQGEDVTEFRPWRFVGKPKTATKAGPDYLPFGMGR